MKKDSLKLLVLLFGMFAFVACGGDNDDDAAGPDSSGGSGSGGTAANISREEHFSDAYDGTEQLINRVDHNYSNGRYVGSVSEFYSNGEVAGTFITNLTYSGDKVTKSVTQIEQSGLLAFTIETDYTYSGDNVIKVVSTQTSDDIVFQTSEIDYSYDGAGYVSQSKTKYESLGQIFLDETVNYNRDSSGKLTSTVSEGTNGTVTTNYTWDSNGNVIVFDNGSQRTESTYNNDPLYLVGPDLNLSTNIKGISPLSTNNVLSQTLYNMGTVMSEFDFEYIVEGGKLKERIANVNNQGVAQKNRNVYYY